MYRFRRSTIVNTYWAFMKGPESRVGDLKTEEGELEILCNNSIALPASRVVGWPQTWFGCFGEGKYHSPARN
jgi:hypothetical protein